MAAALGGLPIPTPPPTRRPMFRRMINNDFAPKARKLIFCCRGEKCIVTFFFFF